jgi:hypothetical protein
MFMVICHGNPNDGSIGQLAPVMPSVRRCAVDFGHPSCRVRSQSLEPEDVMMENYQKWR